MLFGTINYWEGPLRVEGFFQGKKTRGAGFMELVGYPSQYSNTEYLKDQLEKTMSRFLAGAKGNTTALMKTSRAWLKKIYLKNRASALF